MDATTRKHTIPLAGHNRNLRIDPQDISSGDICRFVCLSAEYESAQADYLGCQNADPTEIVSVRVRMLDLLKKYAA